MIDLWNDKIRPAYAEICLLLRLGQLQHVKWIWSLCGDIKWPKLFRVAEPHPHVLNKSLNTWKQNLVAKKLWDWFIVVCFILCWNFPSCSCLWCFQIYYGREVISMEEERPPYWEEKIQGVFKGGRQKRNFTRILKMGAQKKNPATLFHNRKAELVSHSDWLSFFPTQIKMLHNI